MRTNLPAAGAWIRITGGLLATPQGNGLDGNSPGPVPKSVRGSFALVENWEGSLKISTFYNSALHGPIPTNSPLGKSLRKVAEDYGVVRVMSGPLKGKLLNRDLLAFELLTPLELLAAQGISDKPRG